MRFVMLGNYSQKGLEGASAQRTKKANAIAEKAGGRIDSIFALLGGYDLVIIADFPSVAAAMKASIAIGKLTGISFHSLPAVPVDEFDRLIKK
jgi:uncharacterized protein with GYD domain